MSGGGDVDVWVLGARTNQNRICSGPHNFSVIFLVHPIGNCILVLVVVILVVIALLKSKSSDCEYDVRWWWV